MDRAREFGMPGLGVQRGDHICALCRSPQQRDEIMLSFLGEGLRTGDKCICIVDSSRPLQLLAEPNKSIDVEGHVASGQLEVRSSSKAYFGSGDSRLTNCWSIWSKRFAAQYPQAILCLYDASHFVGMVIGLLKTHHKMLFDDVAFEGWRRS